RTIRQTTTNRRPTSNKLRPPPKTCLAAPCTTIAPKTPRMGEAMTEPDLAARVRALHQPSLHRVPVPSIIGDQPACQECGKAWPCPTYQLTESKSDEQTRHI